MMKNLFDSQICVDCGLPCHFGSGRFVNRYSVYADDVEGWRCGECAEAVDSMMEELQNDFDELFQHHEKHILYQ